MTGREPITYSVRSRSKVTAPGQNCDLYPSNNWYNRYPKDFAAMQRASVNVTGGNDKAWFFSNINFMHQERLFQNRSDAL